MPPLLVGELSSGCETERLYKDPLTDAQNFKRKEVNPMPTIRLSVRELVEFLLRTGSIDSRLPA